MTDPKDDQQAPISGPSASSPVEPSEDTYALRQGIVDDVVSALSEGNDQDVRLQLAALHHSDAADLFERLTGDQRQSLVDALGTDLDPEILSEVDETIRDEIIEVLGLDNVAQVIADLDTDDVVEVLGELEEHEQKQVLDGIAENDRSIIEESLSYPEYSAGRLMQRELMAVPEHWTVGEAIDFMRQSADADEWNMPELFYDIFVVDPKHNPIGIIALSRLLKSKRLARVADIMDSEMKLISATTDQEDVAFLFRQRDLVSAPVVDESGRLVGAITVDDVVDVIHEENEEDIMRMGGVHTDDLYSAATETTRLRFTWLLVNLVTAVGASVVISLFDATIEQMVALAVLMPIVASMGGNAGTQTLTVAVRALATKELTANNAGRVIGKELLVGGFNGILFAVLTGAVTWVWFGSPALGLVIALAMIVNMVVAGLAGSTIPLFLSRIGVDPAVASGVFLTTITDVVGFFSFLGLAAWILL